MVTTESPPKSKAGKEKRNVGRARTRFPDPGSAPGQWSWWVMYHMPEDATGKDLAEAFGKHPDTGFKWLSGDATPPVSIWGEIAVWLGITDNEQEWQELVPPYDFVAYVKRYKRLPSDDRFKAASQ